MEMSSINHCTIRNIGEHAVRVSILLVLLSLVAVNLQAQTYYVATTGSDSAAGTFEEPFRTITKAHSVATVPGTTIYVRGGSYAYSTTIVLSRIGTSDNMFKLHAYPGERVFLDFSSMPVADANRGIRITGRYWHVKGFDIWKAGDNGMHISGSFNIVENCSFSENYDTGLQLSGNASYNNIINCDSYFNADIGQGNADGFAPKLDVGTGNYFYGCRAWQNSDDGWDGYLRPADNVTTTLENCWVFHNGYLKSGAPSVGNGNGFKMGGGDNTNADSLRHNMILINCLAFDNRVKGYDQNNNRGSMTLLNCTAYRNGTNYQISSPIKSGSTLTVKNCVSLGFYGSLGSFAIQATNSWMSPFVVNDADFISLDTTGMRGPRQADGSLPILPFMRLAQGSDLIDAGTNVGLPFNGTAPDLGCFESDYPTSVRYAIDMPAAFKLEQNYPNPFNPVTTIAFTVDRTQPAMLEVFNALGQKVATVFDRLAVSGTRYELKFEASHLSSGMYFYTLSSGNNKEMKKLMLLK
ncbi:T9SS type A sorting domain-containing protein [Sphingobacteriales bacterium CHB3]|nr:T9SS type A sorting domain-containing protein [Sphingobacteriales bacterium CHB3]